MFRLSSDISLHFQRGGTLLVPTSQRVRAVQLAHAAAEIAGAQRVWASVDVLTPSRWARRECERLAAEAPAEWPRLLDPTEEWLLWRAATQEAARGFPFLDTGQVAELLQRSSARAAEYGITLHATAPDSEAALLLEAQRGFDARCRALRAASIVSLLPRIGAGGPWGALLARGFAKSPPWMARLTPAAERTPLGSRSASVRALRTSDSRTQMEAIARWCRERLGAQPDARLLVVLPGAPGSRERLAQLIRDVLDPAARFAPLQSARELVAIEGGDSFGSLALPSQALLSLGVLAGETIEMELMCRWLTSPYWMSPEGAARAQLAQGLRERGPASMPLREFLGALQLAPRELRSAARELDAKLRHAARRVGEGEASPRRWSERFETALAVLGWPGDLRPEGTAHRTRVRWRELLEEFGELARCVGNLELRSALELLRALALRSVYRPGDEGAPVTLSPLLADPVVIYDGIWVGSLSADQLPEPPAPDPFLPVRAQVAAGLAEASAAGRRAQAAALLAAWRRSAEELVLSVPARDEDRELLPSPCLAGLTLEEHPAESLWLPLRLHRQGSIERVIDTRGTAFNPLTPLPYGSRSLTLQSACAFRAYAELRLGASPPESPEPGVPMTQRGLLLHAALQMLWDQLRDSERLAALDERALAALIGDCVGQAARALQAEIGSRRRRARRVADVQFDLFTELPPALERECERARVLIARLCTLERKRAPFTVEATEHLTELALGGGRVRLRLDRIDRLTTGRAVLDYKSGRAGSPDWFGERPTHPQLLAYLTALGSDVMALATVNLTAREVRFTGVAASADLLPRVRAVIDSPGAATDWSAQQRSWRELIERLIRAFLLGEAQVDPAPGACDYCHIVDICRIGAHSAAEVSRHTDDSDE
ncbi:MAG TPA: PD-(D/E)XK nuclease family protein [Steroidobacteraceae bacterium]